MSKKNSDSKVRSGETGDEKGNVEIRSGPINISFRKLTIEEQVAAREGRSRLRVTSSQPTSKKN